ncbi:hypothetical protein WJX74_010247 [Apatococcus lobatus]|uniref:Uncharacterized protein n=1 Tax=Apatococcus lobatus TaxID=904363 RepID=A0AAW1SHX7_9CHLO
MDTPEERAYKQVFNQTFVSGLGPTSSHEDLIFLVPRDAGHGTQAFVRRRSQEALSDIHHVRIDWHKTLELNLLVHSEYTLTVAACSYDALHIHRLQDACPNGAGLTQVRRNISALPVHMTVCPDGGKGGWEQPQPSYPNIYFAVDDFQDVFSSLVLPDAHWTYAVLLHAKPSWTWPLLQKPLQQPHPASPCCSTRTLPSIATSQIATLHDGKSGPGSGRRRHRFDTASSGEHNESTSHEGAGSGHFVLSRQSHSPHQSPKHSSPHHTQASSSQHSLQGTNPQAASRIQSVGSHRHAQLSDGKDGDSSNSSSFSTSPAGFSTPIASSTREVTSANQPTPSAHEDATRSAHDSPPEPSQEAQGTAGQEPADAVSSKLLFSGFVSFSQLQQQHLQSQNAKSQHSGFRGGFRSKASLAFAWRPPWLEQGHAANPQPTRVKMTGPGGHGFAEVAVTWLPHGEPLRSRQNSETSAGAPMTSASVSGGGAASKGSPDSSRDSYLDSCQIHAHENALPERANGRRHQGSLKHVDGKGSSSSSVSSEWVPVEKASPGSSSDWDSDAGGWKSKLWSFAASKLPPSLTGAEAVSQDVGPMQVRCALMSLCLPVDLLHQKMTA